MLTAERQALAEENLGLVHACANRFRGRGVEYEDLFQAGCVGLLKAAGGFDESMGFQFSTYAVPAILGEIKRLFRDGGSVKIGRTAKEKAIRLLKLQQALCDALGREPSLSEIASEARMEPGDAALLLSACLPAISFTQEENPDIDVPVPSPEEGVTRRMDLRRALAVLDRDDRALIALRYEKGLTQTKPAAVLGMTQVQVSRREKRILQKMREMME